MNIIEAKETELLALLNEQSLLHSPSEYDTLLTDLTCRLVEMKKAEVLKNHNHTIEYSEREKLWITRVDKPEGTYSCRSDRYRRLKAKTRELLEDKVVAYYKELETRHTIRMVYQEWLDERMEFGEIQKSSRDRFKTDFERFFTDNAFDTRDIATINALDMERFIKKAIHDHNITTKRWQNLKGLIIGIFKYAQKMKYTNFRIMPFLDDLVLPRNMFKHTSVSDDEQVFSDEEVRRIIGWIYETEDRRNSLSNLGILLALTTGLRAGELAALKFSDLKGNVLRVCRTEISYMEDDHKVYEIREFTKGREGYREVVVPNETVILIDLIRSISEDEEYLFFRNGLRTKSEFFSKKLVRICGYLKIKPRSLHKLRKTYASILLDSGQVPDKVVIRQMGHTDIATTQGHYYFDRHHNNEKVVLISEVMQPITDMLRTAKP